MRSQFSEGGGMVTKGMCLVLGRSFPCLDSSMSRESEPLFCQMSMLAGSLRGPLCSPAGLQFPRNG